MTHLLRILAVALVALTGCAVARPAPVTTATRQIAAAPVVIAPAHAEVDEEDDREERRRVVVVETEVEVFDGIDFEDDTAAIAPTSHKILDAIARTMAGMPSIMLLQVRGHSDARGDRVTRAELARARADAVVEHLVKLGVAPERLEAYGASDSEPIGPLGDPRNARIELIIVDRDSD